MAITNVCLWIFTWTPYATVVMIGCFGNRSLVTPLVSALPAFLAKTASCFNPIGKKGSLKNVGLVYTKYWLFFVFNKTKISQSSEFFPNNNSTFNGTVSILHGFHFFTKNLVSGSDASQMCFKPLVLNEI